MKRYRVVSLNVGLPELQNFHGRKVITGICKKPVLGPRKLGPTGFEGDGVGNTKHHGGEDKAVCVYSRVHYPYWEEILGVKMPEAAFGEILECLDRLAPTVDSIVVMTLAVDTPLYGALCRRFPMQTRLLRRFGSRLFGELMALDSAGIVDDRPWYATAIRTGPLSSVLLSGTT